MSEPSSARPPVRIAGVIFAFALNLLLSTLGLFVGNGFPQAPGMLVVAVLVGALLAGLLVTLYARERTAVHAFLGGFLSAPVLALWVFPGQNWRFALLAASFCALGGILSEFWRRRRG